MTTHDVIKSHNSIYPEDEWVLGKLSTNQEIELRIRCCKHNTGDGYGERRSLENFLNGINVKAICDLIVINAQLDEMNPILHDVELLKLIIQGYKYLATCNT